MDLINNHEPEKKVFSMFFGDCFRPSMKTYCSHIAHLKILLSPWQTVDMFNSHIKAYSMHYSCSSETNKNH
jgi:hypothetical protein